MLHFIPDNTKYISIPLWEDEEFVSELKINCEQQKRQICSRLYSENQVRYEQRRFMQKKGKYVYGKY
jgi:hypothetical protein